METVKIVPYKSLNISLDTENYQYLKDVYKFFEHHVNNYMFMPTYQSGKWNGKKSLFRKSTRSLPYGLLTDLIRFTLKNYKDIKFDVHPDVKAMYTGFEKVDVEWNLLYKPHYYQEEVINCALSKAKGIFRCPTASGKSLMISYIIREILHRWKTDQSLIVVPTIGLVTQFKEDMIDYYIPEKHIGMVNKDYKEWGKDIVVSTWQSLSNNTNELERFNAIVVDEVHGVRGDILHNILKQSSAFWRFGFTGTMPKDPLEHYQVQSYLGPVLKHYKSSKLANEGYIATCNVKIIDIHYRYDYTGTFSEVKNNVFANQYRLNIIKQLVKNVDGSILLLVDKVDNEGKILENFLKDQPDLKDKEIFFLWGNINAEERAIWQKRTHQKNNVVLIATFGVFQVGINVKSLKYGALCSSFKSSIRILQSVGRTLRKHISKDGSGAFIFDLNDQVKYLDKHGDERKSFYMEEEFDIEQVYIEESQPILDFKALCQ